MPPVDPISNTQMQPQIVPGLVVGIVPDETFIQQLVVPDVPVPAQDFYFRAWDNFAMIDRGETKRGLNEPSKVLIGGKKGIVRAFAEEYSSKTPLDVNIINAAANIDRLQPNSGGLSYVDQERQAAMAVLVYNERIQREKEAAALVFNASLYDGALQASNVNFGTCTIQTLKDAARAMQMRCGKWPDALILGYKARTLLDVNDNFLDRVSGGANNANPATVTDELLANLLQVKFVVKGMSVIQTLAEPGVLAASATSIWTEDSAAFIYVGDPRVGPQTGNKVPQLAAIGLFNQFTPGFAKCFYANVPNFGLRFGAWSWMADEPNTVEWQKIAEYRLMAQTMKSGYLFTNVDQN